MPFTIKLDWAAYFRRFCEVHGGDPVLSGKYENLWLFRDGWRYAVSGMMAGPEYAPPTDPKELKALKAIYWRGRKEVARKEVWRLANLLESLREMAATRSAPLQATIDTTTDDGTKEKKTVDLNLDGLEAELAFFRSQLTGCDEELKELEAVDVEERSPVDIPGDRPGDVEPGGAGDGEGAYGELQPVSPAEQAVEPDRPPEEPERRVRLSRHTDGRRLRNDVRPKRVRRSRS